MNSPHRQQGVALVVTLLIAAVVLIALVATVAAFTVGNRQVSANDKLTLQAQYAAESGLAMVSNNLSKIQQILNTLQVNFSHGTLQDNMDTVRNRFYRFCYGQPYAAGTPGFAWPPPTPTMDNSTSVICNVNQNALSVAIATSSNNILAANWLPVLTTQYRQGGVEYIPGPGQVNNKYDVYNITDPSSFWAQMVKTGGGASQNLATNPTVRFTTSAGFRPYQIRVKGSSFEVVFRDPDGQGLHSTGEVLGISRQVIAKRVLTQSLSANSPVAMITITPPSYAFFALFFNKQPTSNSNPKKMVYFKNTALFDGPVHTNGNFAFVNQSKAWFGGEFSSAGQMKGRYGYYVGDPGQGRSTTFQLINDAKGPRPSWWNRSDIQPTFATQIDVAGNPVPYMNSSGNHVCIDYSMAIATNLDGSCVVGYHLAINKLVNWARAKVPMPSAQEAAEPMKAMADSGGLHLTSTDFTNSPGSFTVASGTPIPQDKIAKIGEFVGKPSISLLGHGNVQDITISAKVIAGYKLSRSVPAKTVVTRYWTGGWTKGRWKTYGKTCSHGGGGGGTFGGLPSLQGSPSHTIVLAANVDPYRTPISWVHLLGTLTGSAQAQTAGSLPPGYRPPREPNKRRPPNGGNPTYNKPPSGKNCRWNQGPAWVPPSWWGDNPPEADPKYRIEPGLDIYKTKSRSVSITLRYKKGVPGLMITKRPTYKDLTGHTQTANQVLNWIKYDHNIGSAFNGMIYSDRAIGSLSGPKSGPGIAGFARITVASTKNINITGNLTYQDPACKGYLHRAAAKVVRPVCSTKNPALNILGVYSQNGSIVLKPQHSLNKKKANLHIDGILMSSSVSVQTGSVENRKDLGSLYLYGGIIQNKYGALNYTKRDDFHGYRRALTYDQRMLDGTKPPGFPSFRQGQWRTTVSVPSLSPSRKGFWRIVK